MTRFGQIFGLIVFLLAGQVLAQQSSAGDWVEIGPRACDGRTWGRSYDGQSGPEMGFCQPESKGLIVLCTDESCRYTTSTLDQCRVEGGSGKAYRCEVKTLSAAEAKAAVCSGQATAPWDAAGPGYTITIVINGPTCASAFGVIVIRRPDGLPIWSYSTAARWSMTFGIDTPQELAAGLKTVLESVQRNRLTDKNLPFTTADLPEWRDGETSPGCGWVTEVGHQQWNKWRAAKLPALVFMWGQEQETWYLLNEDGSVRRAVGHSPC